MKQTLSRLFLCMAVVLGLSMSASAQVNMTYTGTVNGGMLDGDYTGPYKGTVNGTAMNFVCDDVTPLTQTSWTANVGSTNPVSGGVRFSSTLNTDVPAGATQQQIYNMITWLAIQILNNPNNVGGTDQALNGAIWAITDGWYTKSDYASSGMQADVLAAVTHENTNNGNLIVYTPTSGYLGTDQEFLGTPEPLSMVLMGTFLTLAGLGLGKKKLLS